MKSTEPISFLETETRRRTLRRPVWLAAGGLALTALAAYSVHPNWREYPTSFLPFAILGAGLMATVIAVGLALIRRQASLRKIARVLDQQLGTKNRLEAAAELSNSESPLAKAQRENAGAALLATPPRRGGWLPLGLAALLLALLANAGMFVSWVSHRPPPVVVAPPKEELPTAEFRWKSPESEAKATKIEEVPLAAELRSSHGVKRVTLEMAVNGKARKSVALPDQAAGDQKIEVSMYLDELEVEPYDVVAYHLRAERIYPKPLSATLSPLQFVQVRPFRDDAKLMKMDGMGQNPCLALLKKLKIAQLRLMKENFVLEGSELARTEEIWNHENQRVGEEQALLATKTKEAIDFMIEQGAEALIVDNLTQANPLMDQASGWIRKSQNAKAAPNQGKALALIVECEKLFMKVINEGNSQGGKPSVADPFKDKQQYQLKPRESTPAGQLEQAAAQQKELFKELSEMAKGESTGPANPQPNPGELAKKQQAIAKKLAELAEGAKLSPEAQSAVQQAGQAAEKAAAQLEVQDPGAATEPAAEALKQMQAALGQMNQEAKEKAAEALAQAQRDFNQAAGMAKKEDGSGKAAEAMKAAEAGLFAEAQRQQEAGSGEAAQALAKLARESQKAQGQLKPGAGEPGEGEPKNAPGKGEKKGGGGAQAIEKLAQEAAAKRMKWLSNEQARAEALAELRRVQANLAKPGKGAEGSRLQEELQQDATGALQMAKLLARTPEEHAAVQQLLHQIGGSGGAHGDHADAQTPLSEATVMALAKLIELLAAIPPETNREEVLTEMDPQDAPAKYRDAVARYFEKLSREYRKDAVQP